MTDEGYNGFVLRNRFGQNHRDNKVRLIIDKKIQRSEKKT